jgi:hypothetical protein
MRQEDLLYNHTRRTARQPQPGERLFEFLAGPNRIRASLATTGRTASRRSSSGMVVEQRVHPLVERMRRRLAPPNSRADQSSARNFNLDERCRARGSAAS